MIDTRDHGWAYPAPGVLELVQRFLNLHEHAPGTEADLPPTREMVEAFLREQGLLRPNERFTERDRETALQLHAALHAKVRSNAGEPTPSSELATLDRVARAARLRPSFGPDEPNLVPEARGVAGALGRLLAIVFLADLDGSWGHLKECADETCRSVFYDRSRNRSGRWCSMSACGNRAKVRAWRERQRLEERS
ncbi:MAG TPA: CGNR zinc finger domain-containing protein [Actinomycetota bacterium]|nr:CGNR zinc finger domain-containing protein [Actinomycetota bacterium]